MKVQRTTFAVLACAAALAHAQEKVIKTLNITIN